MAKISHWWRVGGIYFHKNFQIKNLKYDLSRSTVLVSLYVFLDRIQDRTSHQYHCYYSTLFNFAVHCIITIIIIIGIIGMHRNNATVNTIIICTTSSISVGGGEGRNKIYLQLYTHSIHQNSNLDYLYAADNNIIPITITKSSNNNNNLQYNSQLI